MVTVEEQYERQVTKIEPRNLGTERSSGFGIMEFVRRSYWN
jgi:hypothetical protein